MRGRAVKQLLTRVGAHLPAGSTRALNGVVNYLEVGRWLSERGYDVPPRVAARDEVFAAIARKVNPDPALYLEFGVHEGDSLRQWSRLLTSPQSRLHGFDSFEGLPETWSFEEGVGHFSTGGTIPQFDDSRVEIFKGWFDQTLPQYSLPAHERLIVSVDSDLYSSATVVLDKLEESIVPGTFVYFDEFHDRAHELRAFSDFLDRTRFGFEVFAATSELSHVAFIRVS
jgi:hypothetical protein